MADPTEIRGEQQRGDERAMPTAAALVVLVGGTVSSRLLCSPLISLGVILVGSAMEHFP